MPSAIETITNGLGKNKKAKKDKPPTPMEIMRAQYLAAYPKQVEREFNAATATENSDLAAYSATGGFFGGGVPDDATAFRVLKGITGDRVINTRNTLMEQQGLDREGANTLIQKQLAERIAGQQSQKQAKGGIAEITGPAIAESDPAAVAAQANAGGNPAMQNAVYQQFFDSYITPYVDQMHTQGLANADNYEAMMREVIPLIDNPVRQQVALQYMPNLVNDMRMRANNIPHTLFSDLGTKGSLGDIMLQPQRRQQSALDYLSTQSTPYGQRSPMAVQSEAGSVSDADFLKSVYGSEALGT